MGRSGTTATVWLLEGQGEACYELRLTLSGAAALGLRLLREGKVRLGDAITAPGGAARRERRTTLSVTAEPLQDLRWLKERSGLPTGIALRVAISAAILAAEAGGEA